MSYTYLDFLRGKAPYPFAGKYFDKLPEPTVALAPSDVYKLENATPFNYKHVDDTTRQYKNIISNLSEKNASYAVIKTNDINDYKVMGFVITQDLKLYQITKIEENKTAINEEAPRILAIPQGIEYVFALVEIENPWGIS